MAEAARRAQVHHFVYASVAGADRNTGIPIFDAKWRIEQHIRALGLPATVLRPVSFMENYASPAAFHEGRLATAIEPDVSEQLVSVDDIGGFVDLVFSDPSTYIGKVLEIAADEQTPAQIAAAVSRALGREVSYVQIPLDTVRESAGDIAAQAFSWLNRGGYQVDISEVRALRPEILTFDRWLERTGTARIDALRVVA